jgi:23S rRNA pseudoU1915 N3-methylase RlmH
MPGVIAGCCLGLSGCGGGGDGGGGATVQVSGTARFERVPITAAGLDYAAVSLAPIRTARVQIRNAAGTRILAEGATGEDGSWSLAAPASTAVQVVVVAALVRDGAEVVTVVDGLAGDARQAIALPVSLGGADRAGVDLVATAGWSADAGAYDPDRRQSGPFAILDTVRTAQELILSADPDVAFPALTVNWGPDNTAATVGTSFYDPETGELTILGGADEDTDEFDTHVVAHEWGHWFEFTFSRSDSLGGSHGIGDVLDETVAFGEGWGNAFSGMVNDDPIYRDSNDVAQAGIGVDMDLDGDAVGDGDTHAPTGFLLDGGWSEASVQEVLWDLYDGGGGDDDALALGFAPLYAVFVGPQKTTPAFTTIYSFLHALKRDRPAQAAAIAARAAEENIRAHNQYEQTGAGRRRYTVVPADGSVVTTDIDGDALTTYDMFGGIDEANNKLYNRLLFRISGAPGAMVTLTVTPLDPDHDVAITTPDGSIDEVFGGAESAEGVLEANGSAVFSVRSFPTDANPSGVTPFEIQVDTAPSAPAGALAIPVGDG